MATTALYYPWIDPRNRAMLATAILYWDKLYTIVPSSIRNPYELQHTRVAEQLGFLRTRFVGPDCDEVKVASDVFLRDIDRKDIKAQMRNSRRLRADRIGPS